MQNLFSLPHRVGRVLSFSPVVGIGTPPTPHPLWFRGKRHTRWRARGWESPNSDEGTYCTLWYSSFVCTLCPSPSPARVCVCTPLGTQSGATLACWRGGGGASSDDWIESLALCLLVAYCTWASTRISFSEVYCTQRFIVRNQEILKSWGFKRFGIGNFQQFKYDARVDGQINNTYLNRKKRITE